MKPVSLALIVVLLCSSGCATIQHPSTPGTQYASMDACRRANPDSPLDCEKVMHKEATTQAIGVGAVVLVVLGYLALVGYVIAGGR